MKKNILLFVLGLLACAVPAYACKMTEEQLAQAFQKADENQDGFLNLQEYFASMSVPKPEAERQEIFAKLDKDGNRSLVPAEYDPWAGSDGPIPACA